MESADYCDNAINICPTADCLRSPGREEERTLQGRTKMSVCRGIHPSPRCGRSVGRGRKEEERTRSQVSSFTTGLALVFEIRE